MHDPSSVAAYPSHLCAPVRLRALRRLDLLDHLAEAIFDLITQLAGLMLQALVALITLADAKRRACLGKGSTLMIDLPRMDDDSYATRTPHGGSETVLLVEDDPAVRELAGRVLRRLGYTVLESSDGVDALEVAQHVTHPIDLLLTDVVMPRMRGTQLVDVLRVEMPNLRVIMMSGYTDQPEDVALRGVFLPKPFMPAALARLVREVLDG